MPYKYITVDDKDPVRMNETIKSKIEAKNALYKKFIQNDLERFKSDFIFLENVITELTSLSLPRKLCIMKTLQKS